MDNSKVQAGFTLPVVLISMAGLLVLLGSLMTIVVLERRTSRSHLNAYNADLAARSALSEVRTLLARKTASDSYVIFKTRIDVHATGGARRPYLFLAENVVDEGERFFEYTPLFSAERAPSRTKLLESPVSAGLPDDTEKRVALRALPWERAPDVAWENIRDDEERVVGRYAWWIEDTEGYLDAQVAGNDRGEAGRHVRMAEEWPAWPASAMVPPAYPPTGELLPAWPVPGLSPVGPPGHPLDQIALYALAAGGSDADETDFDDRLFGVRDHAPTAASLLAAMDVAAPLKRDADGRLVDDTARWLEENLTVVNRSYDERSVIPPVPGIGPSMIGEARLNLNAALESQDGVEQIAAHLRAAFPDFDQRKGGFPEDYAATLAANMIDYADHDSDSTRREGSHRGLDAYPFVSEWLMRFKWEWEDGEHAGEGVVTDSGRKYVLLSVTAYAELWNLSSHPVKGDVQFDYETHYAFPLGVIPDVSLIDGETLGRSLAAIDPEQGQSGSAHALTRAADGRWYFPPLAVSLAPNEIAVRKLGTVRYMLDAGPAAIWVPSPLQLDNDFGRSRYTMKWNGAVVDQARGAIGRSASTLHFPSNTSSKPRQKVRCTLPGFVYGSLGRYRNNMGDPRISYYADAVQAQNSYPANYSGWRRNVRLRIFREKRDAIYGRVLPSEWPDGGHDSEFGTEAFYTTDQRIDPDDPRFAEGRGRTEPRKAPMRLSNLGRFFSPTELGHIFDPVMWAADHDLPWGTREVWTRDVTSGSIGSAAMGGGNTLRVGRPEHGRFDRPGLRATGLLDIYHCGMPLSEDEAEQTGALVRRHGHVNINTAPRDVLRSLMAGKLAQDPELAREISAEPTAEDKAPATERIELGVPANKIPADIMADAIVASRPFVSTSQLAQVVDRNGRPVFGNRDLYPQGERLQWSDAAAEEAFARIHNNATVRSRNFRVHVIGQAMRDLGDGRQKVLATRRKVFRVFVDPGERDRESRIVQENVRIEVLYEMDR